MNEMNMKKVPFLFKKKKKKKITYNNINKKYFMYFIYIFIHKLIIFIKIL